jgi:type IV pilus assembly protein PilZ
MDLNPENRDKTRFDHESSVTLENSNIGVQRGARMYNYSDMGLYFEADYRLEPETEVRIGISNSPFAAEPDIYESYRGIIKWRKPLKRSAFYYGYGIALLRESEPAGTQGQDHGSRVHPRINIEIPVTYESEARTYQGTTQNVSNGGAFIKTRDPVAVGQLIMLDIPFKKKGKIKRLTGKVTWSNRQGFGVKFVRSS